MSETAPVPANNEPPLEEQPRDPAPATARFTILFDPSITVDELRLAFAEIGVRLAATPNGWVAERVHIFALVKKDGSQ